MYADVMRVMDGARTIKEHITKLQGILDSSPADPKLASLLRDAISSLMDDQLLAIQQGTSSRKARMNPNPTAAYKQLYSYCQPHATAGTPQWQVAALNAGWTPPTTP